MRRFILFVSSNAGLGYSPVAPGTVGTLAGIPAFWLLAPLPPFRTFIVAGDTHGLSADPAAHSVGGVDFRRWLALMVEGDQGWISLAP